MDFSKIQIPFEGYGWHWGAATPTESFNRPDIFFGCLKVLYDNEGKKINTDGVYNALKIVETDLEITEPKLARAKDRNLFRNSGQYWKNLGVLETTQPFIKLTSLGKSYAEGRITKHEYACYLIKTMCFPKQKNTFFYDRWSHNDLKIKPLELLLRVLAFLFENDENNSFLTPNELIHVIIPFSGHKFPIDKLAETLLYFRENKSAFNGAWHPPIFNEKGEKTNNIRIAREFLYFLNLYGFLDCRESRLDKKDNSNQEFFIPNKEYYQAIIRLLDVDVDVDVDVGNSISDIVNTSIQLDKESEISDVFRERKLIAVLSRPNQNKFRKEVIKAADGRCLITNITTLDVLQACHIKQVSAKGGDNASNGILLRVDLHLLYDKGHLKILEDGTLLVSDYLLKDEYYSSLIPKKIVIPEYIDKDAIRKRNSYSEY
ncbi:HNH endonuclease signature motif containing protein [Shewanella xiamenensis]|uniref:HNH endonuclease n=1 Tax=Shewanella xiamenensis TaxID=332186 RepID=UPI00313C789A